MPYFLSAENLSLGAPAEVSGEEAAHILQSHRVKIGERIKLQGPDGNRYLAEVLSTSKKALTVKVLQSLPVTKEPEIKITLFQSVVSEKALDFIFQKGTELGLAEIVLFNSTNTAVKLSDEIFKKKSDRWNKILIESAKQSERAARPVLSLVKDLDSMISLLVQEKIFLADLSGNKLGDLKTSHYKSLALVVGPEGGLSPEELIKIRAVPNLEPISLGGFILRAETAAIAGVSIFSNLT